MISKPLEQCTLPELAQRLVEDLRRQAFNTIWMDEGLGVAPGVVNDKVQVMRAQLDRGVDPDEEDALGRTALDILVDPANYIPSDPKTVLALLEAGARTSEHVMTYIIGRLYSENVRGTALMFHARSQSDKPLIDPARGNYYHALIDNDKSAFVLIAPMLDMVRRHDVDNLAMDPEEIALLASWVFETRSLDGNNPVMLAWNNVDTQTFYSPGEAQHFQEYSLPDLWKLTVRYLRNGGDLAQKNYQGNSILSHILAHDPNLDSKAFTQAQLDDRGVDTFRAHLAAIAMDANTAHATAQAPRPRM